MFNSISKRTRWAVVMSLVAVMVLTVSCNPVANKPETGDGNNPPISPNPSDETVTLIVYFADDTASHLVPVERTIVKRAATTEELVIGELIKGTDQEGLSKTIPDGTQLLSVETVETVAYVNFSKEFQTNHWGGSAGETMTLMSVVNSLTELDGVDSVQFLLEGKVLDSILGHFETAQPIERNERVIIGGDTTSGASTEPGETGEPTQPTLQGDAADPMRTVNGDIEITLYFSDSQAMFVEPTTRTVAGRGRPLASILIEELIAGPGDSGLGKTIPDGTQLLDVNLQYGVARVNFSKEIRDNHWGGSAGETMTIFSIVATLTELEGIDAVLIKIEGATGETIGGHIILDDPIPPDNSVIKGR